MKMLARRWSLVGLLLCCVPMTLWAQTKPAKLERLKIAVAPLGWDTNFSWLQSRSGMLDKRPVLEYLISVDPKTGAYIPQLAESWDMAPDGKSWTLKLRKGVKFHEDWGEFTARDVRHSIFLITQPESVQTDAGTWRTMMGIEKNDAIGDVEKKVADMVKIVDDYTVVINTKIAAPELVDSISANADLVMESKARWDKGGKELYGQKIVGTGPFAFVERKVGSHVLYKRVENHWRQTPEFKELEFRWVPEGVTRLASLIAGEVHISDIERSAHKEAVAKGLKLVSSTQTAIGCEWLFGGMYFATPDKLDAKQPFVDKRVRQAMNMAINRQAVAEAILGTNVEPMRVVRYYAGVDEKLWPGIYNASWDKEFDSLYGYNPQKAKELLKQAGHAAGFEFTVYLYTVRV